MSPSPMSSEEQLNYLLSFYDKFVEWRERQRAAVAALDPATLAMAEALGASFRPFVNHVVKAKRAAGADERAAFEARARKVVETGMNSFYFPAELLEVDFLSDSGSAAMNAE